MVCPLKYTRIVRKECLLAKLVIGLAGVAIAALCRALIISVFYVKLTLGLGRLCAIKYHKE
jgi:uncharacterized membrane protein YGL010W